MAASLSSIRFSNEGELLRYKKDFRSALLHVTKLDEVDVSGVEPLANVFEFYGGNEYKMHSGDPEVGPDFLKNLKRMN